MTKLFTIYFAARSALSYRMKLKAFDFYCGLKQDPGVS